MNNKIVTHFYVKEAKKDRIGEAPIYLRITVNGERAEIKSNRRVDPEIWDKSAELLQEEEKTIYYERCAFIFEVPSINSIVNGNKLSLSVGGVRAYNSENLYGKKTEEHFKVFIGFKNHVCINLCITTDGFLDDLRVMSVQELFNRVFQLLTRFDAERQINHLSTLSEYTLTEHQFAQLVGKSRLYQYLPHKTKKALDTTVPISDTQISTVGRDYYEDHSARMNPGK
jgi:hypothetical protein